MSLTMLKPFCELFFFCLTILNVVNFSQCNQEIVYIQAANTSLIRDPVKGLYFANFRKHNTKFLSVKPLQVLIVKSQKLCEVKCVSNHQCSSFNLAVKPDNEGNLRCELLATDMFNSSTLFVNDTDFLHFSIKSSCFPMPCKNDRMCIPFYTNNTHKCNCTHPFYGERCEKVEGHHWGSWGRWSDTCGLPPICLSLTKTRSRNCTYRSAQVIYASNGCIGQASETSGCTPITPVDTLAKCAFPLGLEDGRIKDSQMTASSYYSPENLFPHKGRLNHQTIWASGSFIGQYLQVDLVKKTKVTKIATQGRTNNVQRVTKYTVKYSDDGNTWRDYGGACIKIFDGNSADSDTVVTNTLEIPIEARYIRIYPTKFNNWMSMRLELYGCELP